jgi:lipopolysaccharide assembly outer membrane protein LptD (OstA)
MNAVKLSFFLLCMVCCMVVTAQSTDGDPIVLGDERLVDDRYYISRGHAELFWRDYHIFADEIIYDTRERVVRAKGRVAINEKDNVISGDAFMLDLKTMKGEMENVFGMAPPTVSFHADHLKQTDRNTFEFDHFFFSSCGQLNPDWSIRAQQGKIKRNRYIEMKHVVFRINVLGGLPIFYLPYFRYPLNEDGRSTGFLFPEIGTSKQKGIFVRSAFFWDLASNIDFTAKTDWFEKIGYGLGADLKYIFRGGSHGSISYYYLHQKDDSVYKPEDRSGDYQLRVDHEQRLPFLNSRFSVNINRESNPLVRQLFSESFVMSFYSNFYTRVKLDSQLFKNLSLSIGAANTETYYNIEKKSLVTETLPTVSLNLSQLSLSPLPGRLSLGMTAEAISKRGTNFDPDNVLYDTDISTKRLQIKPNYILPVLDAPWLSLSLNLSSQYQFYSNRKDLKTKKPIDLPLTLSAYTISFDLQGLKLEKVFKGAATQLQHLFYPEVTVSYSTPFDENLKQQVVRVDERDYTPFSYMSFSLKNKLRYKKTTGNQRYPSDLLDWSIGINYYIDAENAHKGRKIEGEFTNWGPLSNRLRISPSRLVQLDLSLQYNIYVRYLTSSMVSLSLANEERTIDTTLHYSQYRDPYFPDNAYSRRSSLGASFLLAPETWPVTLNGQVAYSMNKYENNLSAGLHCDLQFQCWTFGLGVQRILIRDNNNELVPDLRFQFGIKLGHMSSVTDLFSGQDR